MIFNTELGSTSVAPSSIDRAEQPQVICGAKTMAYAKILCPPRLPKYTLAFETLEQSEGVTGFVVLDGGETAQVLQPGIKQLAMVPITWLGTDKDTPRTWGTHSDNWDQIFMDPRGRFVDIECCLFTRGSDFFIGAQKIYDGWVTRTRTNGRLESAFIPADPIHAYPGAKFRNVWSTVADLVLGKSDELDARSQKSRVKPAVWNPPSLPTPGKNRKVGVVTYFNLHSGTGEILDPTDGVRYYVHFSKIIPPEGSRLPEVRVLDPMSAVFFRPDESNGKGRIPVKFAQPVSFPAAA